MLLLGTPSHHEQECFVQKCNNYMSSNFSSWKIMASYILYKLHYRSNLFYATELEIASLIASRFFRASQAKELGFSLAYGKGHYWDINGGLGWLTFPVLSFLFQLPACCLLDSVVKGILNKPGIGVCYWYCFVVVHVHQYTLKSFVSKISSQITLHTSAIMS